MAMLIVSLFEMVHIKHQHGQRSLVTNSSLMFALQKFHKEAFVVNIGQTIVDRHSVNFFMITTLKISTL